MPMLNAHAQLMLKHEKSEFSPLQRSLLSVIVFSMANGIEDMNVFIIKKWLQVNHASLLVVAAVMVSALYQAGGLEEVKIEVQNNANAIHELKVDVNELRVDVNELKIDVNGLKADVNALKSDVNALKVDVKNNTKNINILTGKVDILIKNDYQNHRPAPTALSP